jgi:hypothetical protein
VFRRFSAASGASSPVSVVHVPTYHRRQAPGRRALAQPWGGYVSCSVMPATPPAPADRFARLIEGLCRAVAARGGRGGLAGPLVILIWTRLRGILARISALAERIATGRYRQRHALRRPRPGPRRPPLRRPLPQSMAWLIRLVPEAAAGASQLRHLLADPDMAALLAAAPQMRRLLRPLCRMLGVRPPPGLLTPPPAAPPAAPPAPRRPAAERPPPGAAPPGRPPPRPPRPAPAVPARACGPPALA